MDTPAFLWHAAAAALMGTAIGLERQWGMHTAGLRTDAAVVESVKTASDIYSPVSGEIVESNKTVAEKPDLVNSDPYGQGWFYKIKLANPAELSKLLTPADYKSQLGQ